MNRTLLFLSLAVLCPAQSRKGATVPIILEHNRVLVDLTFGAKTVRAWVDTGNPDFMISETLARAIGLPFDAAKAVDGRVETPAPAASIGGLPLRFDGVACKIVLGGRWFAPGLHVDANVPATALRRYHLILDYPGRRLSLAAPGSAKPRGYQLPCRVHERSGVVDVDVAVNGSTYAFALDNGCPYSYISDRLMDELVARHREWPFARGAAGVANMWGLPMEGAASMTRVAELYLGELQLDEVGVSSFPAAMFEWYSKKTVTPVIGILGGNVLKAFRVEIDYAGSAVYLERKANLDPHDLDTVGLTLRPDTDGSYHVVAVTEKDGQPVVDEVNAGDRLLKIGGLEVSGKTMGEVSDALHGKPGDVRVLVLERAGKQVTVHAKVTRLL